MYGADKSSAASRYATESSSQLGNRGYDINERGQDFDQAIRLEHDPVLLQNEKIAGMYPTGPQNFAAPPGGSIPGGSQADYASQINAANARGAAATGSGINTGLALGGDIIANRNKYDPNYTGAGAPRGDG
jgi:hypothetical protein